MSTIKKTTLRSTEFSCPSCVRKIEGALEHVDGVQAAEVFFSTGRIVVEHDPAIAPVEKLVKTIGDVGYVAKATAF